MKKEESNNIGLGTEAWNVADGYTKIKILRHLIQLDRYDTIAQFGTEDIGEDINLTDNQLKKRRVEALERFYSTIKQLLGNTSFAMRSEDKTLLKTQETRIKNLEPFISKVYSMEEDRVSHEEVFSINEKLFKSILIILEDIKDLINTPLNHAGLIFKTSDEVDLDKIMSDIEMGG